MSHTAAAVATDAPTAVATPDTKEVVTPVARVNRWLYHGTKRDLRYDFMRGCAVIAMTVDHIGGEQSLLYFLTGANTFFVSAAEVFVFLSGLVFGIVEVSLIVRQGIDAALTKALRRVGVLYAFTTGLTVAFALVSAAFQLKWAPKIPPGGALEWLVSILTLHRAFYLTDVLLLYVLLILVSAPVLLLLEHNYTRFVLAGSWGLWALWQWSPQFAAFPWPIADNPVFNFPAWQLLFINGLVIGFHRKGIGTHLNRRISVWGMLIISGGLFVGLLALHVSNLAPLVFLTGASRDTLRAYLFDKDHTQIGRVIAFAIFMSFAFCLLTVVWQPLERALGWLILPLGSHALGAYITHLFVVAVLIKAQTLFPPIGGDVPGTILTTLIQAAGVGIVWVVIALQPTFTTFIARLRGGATTPATAATAD